MNRKDKIDELVRNSIDGLEYFARYDIAMFKDFTDHLYSVIEIECDTFTDGNDTERIAMMQECFNQIKSADYMEIPAEYRQVLVKNW